MLTNRKPGPELQELLQETVEGAMWSDRPGPYWLRERIADLVRFGLVADDSGFWTLVREAERECHAARYRPARRR